MSLSTQLKKKILRFQGSKNVLKINYFYHKIFGEDLGELGLDFSKKETRDVILQKIIDTKKYKSYLEIGCFNDDLFNKIKCEKKIGVDPYSGGTIRKTSDDFFNANDEKFDCIFIDGLHRYYQVKKDIDNSLKSLNENGIIILHDCLPNNYYEQAIPRSQYIWNGDVWKAIIECRTREDIDTYTINADFGLGVIFKKKNTNMLNLNVSNFSKLKFSFYFNDYKKLMNLIEFEEFIEIIS
tara:strand:- start:3564 stop:4280 length:717 start_codon:yes stop_codon:yes gene_type:complete